MCASTASPTKIKFKAKEDEENKRGTTTTTKMAWRGAKKREKDCFLRGKHQRHLA